MTEYMKGWNERERENERKRLFVWERGKKRWSVREINRERERENEITAPSVYQPLHRLLYHERERERERE